MNKEKVLCPIHKVVMKKAKIVYEFILMSEIENDIILYDCFAVLMF